MAQQACKGECAATLVVDRHGENPGPRPQLIAGLILSGLIERRLRSYQDAILVQRDLVGPHPASLRTQHAMIRREREGAAVLEHNRYALPLALVHALGLRRHLQFAFSAGRKHAPAAREGQRLDAACSAVRERYGSAL